MNPSYNQSIENYDYYYYDIKTKLNKQNTIQITSRIMILDEFFKLNLINLKFYNDNKSKCIKKDKKDNLKDFYYSYLCISFILTIFLYLLPDDKHTFLKYIYIFYLFIVYFLTYMFYRLLV